MGLSNICQDVSWSIGVNVCVISNWLILRVCVSAMEVRIGCFQMVGLVPPPSYALIIYIFVICYIIN